MKIKLSLLVLFAASIAWVASAQTQLIVNGGFESGLSPWQILAGNSSSFAGVQTGAANSGSSFLSMGNVSGASQDVYQTITIPTNAIYPTLSYFWNEQSSDNVGSDQFYCAVTGTNFTVLQIVDSESNANANQGYQQVVFSLVPFIGQTVDIVFEADTDQTQGNLTRFSVDDVSATYITTADLPVNDNFANASALGSSNSTVLANNTYATKEPGEPNHAGNAGGKSLWWSFTPASNGTITLSTSNSSIDTLLAVYTGSVVSNLTKVTSDDDFNSDRGVLPTSQVKFAALAGTEFEIAVDGKNGAAGAISLNLTFKPDTTKPTVTISTPASGAKVTNSTINVTGKATDNIGVALVEFRLENAAGTNDYQPADGSNTWSAIVDGLIPGPNTVRVRAWDVSSNLSATVSRTLDFVIVSPLTLIKNGSGTISPDLSNELLQVGATYKMTAKPAAGQIFAGWTGDTNSAAATLTFKMQTNLTLYANFIPNPFVPMAGVYHGLIYDTNGVAQESSGFITANVSTAGKLSAKLQVAGKSYSSSGPLAADGSYSNAIPVKGGIPLTLWLQFAADGSLLSGGIQNPPVWAAEVSAYKTPYSKTAQAPQQGRYTMVLSTDAPQDDLPPNWSYGTVVISSSGGITFAGALSDGTKVSQKTFLLPDGLWPFYLPLYSGHGCAIGWISLVQTNGNAAFGDVRWIKKPISAKYYSAGFTNDVVAFAAGYQFTHGQPVSSVTNVEAVLRGGGLTNQIDAPFTLSAAGKGANPDFKLSISVAASTGLFKGSILNPQTGKPLTFNGVLVQPTGAGLGFFLGAGTNIAGSAGFGD
jgi:uncharacterized repeat protein (TIGR02543 family)